MSTQTFSLAKNVYTAIAGPGNLVANITANQPAQIVFSATHPQGDVVGHHLELNQGISVASMGAGIIAWAKSELDSASAMVTLSTDATVTTGASGNGGGNVVGGPGSLTIQSNGSTLGTAPTINVSSTKANIGVVGNLATLTVNVASNLDIESNGVDQGNATALNFTGAGSSITVAGSTATFNVPGSSLVVSDEGTSQGTATSINVVGIGGSAAVVGSGGTINVPGIKILDEGANQNFAASINFVGAQVTADVSGGAATVTVPLNQNTADIYLSPTGGDDSAQIWTAYQTLYNNGRGGTIHLSSGVFYLNTAQGGPASCIGMLINHPGMITIKGAGKFATYFSCTYACSTLVSCNVAGISHSNGLMSLLTLQDFTISCNSNPYNGNTGVIFSAFGNGNSYADLNFYRVDTVNLPAGGNYPWRTSVDLEVYATHVGTKNQTGFSQPLFSIDRITFEDCDFCLPSRNYNGGYGGNYGIQIAGSTGGFGATGDTISHADQDDWIANCVINDINISRCRWDGCIYVSDANKFSTVVADGHPQWAGTGIIIGGSAGHGARWNITDCVMTRSGDDNFEINSGTSITLTRCTGDSGNLENFFFENQAGMPSDQSQVIRLIGCKTQFNYYVQFVTGNYAGGAGNCIFSSYAGNICGIGHVIIEDHIGDVKFLGSCKSISIKNHTHKTREPQLTLTCASNGTSLFTGAGIGVALTCGQTNLSINNVIIDDYNVINYNGKTGNIVTSSSGISIGAQCSINLAIEKVAIGNHISILPGSTGSGAINWTSFSLPGGATVITDALFRQYGGNTVSALTAGYICDSGNRTDVNNPYILASIDNGFGLAGTTLTVTYATYGINLNVNTVIVGAGMVVTINGTPTTIVTTISARLSGTGTTGTYTVRFSSGVTSLLIANEFMSTNATILVVDANINTEKRFVWQGHYNIGGYSGCACTGPFVDACWWIASTPGSSTISGHKTGIMLKRQYPKLGGALSYIDCYLTDNGTNTFVKIDLIVNGTRTNKATITSATRIAASTIYWLMASIKGNLITVTYKSVAPGNYNSQFTSGVVAQISYTLTGYAEIFKFGGGQLGWGGFSWVPADSAAIITSLSYNPLIVMEGAGVNDVTFKSHDNLSTFTAIKYADPTVQDRWVRFNNTLNLTNFNMTGASATTALDQTAGLSTIALQNTRRSGNWLTPVAPAAITVTASPFTYTNSDGCDEDVAVYGGTLTSAGITISRDKGASFSKVADVGYNVFNARLNPGDIVVVTYSVAPTMKKVPIY